MSEEAIRLPAMPDAFDWANVAKLGEETDEAAVLLYGPEIAARMKVAGMMLRQMPQIMQEYARAAVLAERERAARVCDELARADDTCIGDRPDLSKFGAAIRKGA